ncbi:MAG: alanine racemase, partial [bacterium]
MFETSCIELSKSALCNNLSFLRKQIGDSVTISSVVKGNAYGHGIESFVPLVEECGVRHFSVFNASEAFEVSQCLRRKSEIMITGCVAGEALEWAIGEGISFYVYDLHRLQESLAVARRLNKQARLHLELETGLNRTGLKKDELAQAVEVIGKNPETLEVVGVCTHYAGAESIANYKRIMDQIKVFNRRCDFLAAQSIKPGLRHSAASAAALVYPETRMDLVRIGIA